MCEEKWYGNRKSDIASLGKKLKLHLLIYILIFEKYIVDHINM